MALSFDLSEQSVLCNYLHYEVHFRYAALSILKTIFHLTVSQFLFLAIPLHCNHHKCQHLTLRPLLCTHTHTHTLKAKSIVDAFNIKCTFINARGLIQINHHLHIFLNHHSMFAYLNFEILNGKCMQNKTCKFSRPFVVSGVCVFFLSLSLSVHFNYSIPN